MKNKENNFERNLPDGYEKALTIDAKSAKAGTVFTILSFIILGAVLGVAYLLIKLKAIPDTRLSPTVFRIANFVFVATLIIYIVLHELVHGAAYKALTGEKLTFGMSWSCAFCGVPKIYTYRRAALIAVNAPFVIFTVLMLPVLIYLYTLHSHLFFIGSIVFGMHLGGCIGDLYVSWLLSFVYRDDKTLMNDTGPVMTLYVPTK